MYVEFICYLELRGVYYCLNIVISYINNYRNMLLY